MSGDDNFLSRWSRRKHQSKRDAPPLAQPAPVDVPAPVPAASAVPALPPEPAPPLPPVESLTPESDFAPFMQAGVDGDVKRDALKKLFADPRFNVMDGLDVYIDDYSKPDPLPEGWLEKLNQVRHLGDFKKAPPEEPAEQAQEEPGTPSLPPASDAARIDSQQVPESDPLPASDGTKDATSRS